MANDFEHLNAAASEIVRGAHLCAQRLHTRVVETEHVLLSLLEADDPVVTVVLEQMDMPAVKLHRNILYVVNKRGRTPPEQTQLSESVRAVLREAWREARASRADEARPEHLLLGLLRQHECLAAQLLDNAGVTLDRAHQVLGQIQRHGAPRVILTQEGQARAIATPTLNLVSRDLTAAAQAGMLDPLIGREDELERTMQVLARRMKNNPVLIGHAGVGKSAIAEGLAMRIVQRQVPEFLLHMRVIALDTGLLTIGTKYRGDFEERLKRIVAEIVAVRNLIIVVDELHTLIGAGVAEGSVDAANLLKPILARGDFRCIGTTTLEDYRKTIERDPALERRFQPILIRAATPAESLEILFGLKERYEAFHRVRFMPEALRAAVTLSTRYVQDRQLPDKAIDLVDEAAARLSVGRSVQPADLRALRERLALIGDEKESAIQKEDFPLARALWKEEQQLRRQIHLAEDAWLALHERDDVPVVTERDIATVVAAWTGIPAVEISSEETERLLKLEDLLHERIVGQDDAVAAVARALRRNRSGMRDPRRPIGSFIFAGPTGVGKTELARALAELFFGEEQALIAFDMSEFQEPHYVARLTGAPPGYIGYEQAGKLTEAVRRRPYCVLLFDEIEKAHPRVYDLLLQVVEDGYLTDAKGHRVDFRNTIILLTSNAGMEAGAHHTTPGFTLHDDAAARAGWLHTRTQEALRQIFRPEMLNRIDEVVQFAPLSLAQMHAIAQIMLARLQQRLAERHLTLTIGAPARDLLVQRGFDPEYGARPLRRAIQSMLEDPLAEGLLDGTFHPGDIIAAEALGTDLVLLRATPVPLLPAHG